MSKLITEQQWESAIRRGQPYRYIAPSGTWKCFCCLQSHIYLQVLKQTRDDVYLICRDCLCEMNDDQKIDRLLF